MATKHLFPIVADAIALHRRVRDAKTSDTRRQARIRLAKTLEVMTAKAAEQYFQALRCAEHSTQNG